MRMQRCTGLRQGDAAKIGIQGQSWGGYHGLYMITQTKIFSAAVLGAPVVNMLSAYGGIGWGTGCGTVVPFDHQLRGKAAPEWMKKGIPYPAKRRDQVPATAPTQAGGTLPDPSD